MSVDLKDKISLLPRKPGIYKFKNAEGEVIYIGKATDLKSRVGSYFSTTHFDRPRIIQMIELITDLETIETENEIEALVLESALIKEYQPLYNSDLKDGKSYAWLYINTQDDYPTVKIVRSIKQSDYKKGKLFGPYPSGRAISRVFKYLRKLYPFCTSKDPKKPCFHYYIGLCPGPDATKKEYRENINGIIRFLNGRKKTHIVDLERKMRRLAKSKQFEKAAELRDKISDLRYLGEKIGFNYFSTEQDYLISRDQKIKDSLKELAEELGIRPPERIECYDISNIQGKLAYGSMVVSINGLPESSLYRVFKIKNLQSPNDPEMLKEVLERRIKHLGSNADESLGEKPDLIVIDGGKTQLKAVHKSIPKGSFLLGITKGKRLKRAKKKARDEFWVMRNGIVFNIEIKNPQIISSLRDESHRFALLHHRKLRKFVQKKSVLDEIKGIGPKRKRELLKKFDSVKGIKKAKKEELLKVVKNELVVERLVNRLKKV